MLSKVEVCPCGSVATTMIATNTKSLPVCSECESMAMVKLLKMSLMMNSGTRMDVADRWSK